MSRLACLAEKYFLYVYRAEDVQSFLEDGAHWLEHGTLERGDVLYLPVGAVIVSRTRVEHVVGVKYGCVAPLDTMAVGNLSNLLRWSKENFPQIRCMSMTVFQHIKSDTT